MGEFFFLLYFQNGGYRVNEDGSVTRINNNSSNNSGNNNNSNHSGDNNNNGCIWTVVIAIIIIIGIVSFIKSANDSDNKDTQSDTKAVQVTEKVVEGTPVNNTQYNTSNYQTAYSDACTLKRMDQIDNGYMLIPNFLTDFSIDEDGWMVYSNDKGAYITSAIFDYNDTPYQYISSLSKDLNSRYSVHKDNWAVDSGLLEHQIYYMKAVKYNEKLYCAIFVVPRGDKPNAKLYGQLTEKIFKKSNFPSL